MSAAQKVQPCVKMTNFKSFTAALGHLPWQQLCQSSCKGKLLPFLVETTHLSLSLQGVRTYAGDHVLSCTDTSVKTNSCRDSCVPFMFCLIFQRNKMSASFHGQEISALKQIQTFWLYNLCRKDKYLWQIHRNIKIMIQEVRVLFWIQQF